MTNTTAEYNNLHFSSDQAIPLPSYDDDKNNEEESSQFPSSFVGMVVGDDASASLGSLVWRKKPTSFNSSNKNGSRHSSLFSVGSSITMTDFDYSSYLLEELGHLDNFIEEEGEDDFSSDEERHHTPKTAPLQRMHTTESFDSAPSRPMRRVSSASQLSEDTGSHKIIASLATNSRRVSTSRNMRNCKAKDSQPCKPGRRVSDAVLVEEQPQQQTAKRQDSQPSMPGRRVSFMPNNNNTDEEEEENAQVVPRRTSPFTTREGRADGAPLPPVRHGSTNWNELIVL